MTKKRENERQTLKKLLRGHLKGIATSCGKHYETVRESLNGYVETGIWTIPSVGIAVTEKVAQLKKQQQEQQEALEAQLKEKELV